MDYDGGYGAHLASLLARTRQRRAEVKLERRMEERNARAEEIEAALKDILGLAIMPDASSVYQFWDAAVQRGRKSLDMPRGG